MDIRFQNTGPEQWGAQILLAPCCEGEHLPDLYPDLDKACPWLAVAPALHDFKGKKDEIAILHGHPDLKVPRVLALGLGKRQDVTLGEVRNAIASASRKCRSLGLASALLPVSCLSGLAGGRDRLVEESVCAFKLGLYEFSELKTRKPEDLKDPATFILAFSEYDEAGQKAARHGEIAADAVRVGRDLDNLPGNLLYPELFALRAIELGQKHGFKCTVFAKEALEEMGAGCLLGVGQGSAHPPRLVVLEYAPDTAMDKKPVVFVGKGITFDSGGLCLKPAAGMDQMKCDMSGAAAVLAAITAAAIERLDCRLVGVLALAENMPDGRAYRPGDVLTALNGQTVEVLNTDAEGRLVLADALSYVYKNYEPETVVDIATLTGACAIALGNGVAGLFCDDSSLAEKIAAYGAVTGEDYWRLPLWKPYEDSLKSNVADISHKAGREGGAITAALFLKNFVQGVAWAHLDIAGVDWNSKRTPLCPEGASGFGIRTLLELARGAAA